MTSYVFEPVDIPTVTVQGRDTLFPVHRIYCVGRNYVSHTVEMGGNPDKERPFFFAKPNDAVVPDGSTLMFPTNTRDLHHEIELVVAIGKGGGNISAARANEHIFGYAVGLDMTRRDLQAQAKKAGRPWEASKGFEQSAPLSSIYPVQSVGLLHSGKIWLKVNGEIRQQGDLSQLIWSIPEVIAHLSQFFILQAGDLIFTGTPSGVGAVKPGDRLQGGIGGLGELTIQYQAVD